MSSFFDKLKKDKESNEITPTHDFQVAELSEQNQLDEKTEKQIKEGDYNRSDVPSANVSGRDNNDNKKKAQLVIIAIVGLLIVLIGIGMSMAKWQENKEISRVEEAERKAQEQKKMAEGTVNIKDDQEKIASSKMYDLPPPASVEDTTKVETPPVTATQPPPVTPVYEPTPTPAYEPIEEPVTVQQPPQQPFFEPKPVQQQPLPPVKPPLPKGADSHVMVDVKSIKKVTATQKETDTGVGGKLTPTVLKSSTATRRVSKSLVMLKGTTIPCVLKTKIDSTYKGFTICQTNRDVYSADGQTLLVERGSQVFGEQNIEIEQGQARVAVLWNRIETPQGVSVDVNSPAVGQLGEMGIGAKVNNHYGQRFGAAILLSVIQDGIEVGFSRWKKDQVEGDDNTINNTKNTSNEMAEETLKHSIDIPPTATVNQGTLINIMVARDVDFSDVYKLERR